MLPAPVPARTACLVMMGIACVAITLRSAPARAVENGAWTQLATSGPQPTPRRDTGVIYDPVRDRLVVMGGGGITWTLDLASPAASWVNLSTTAYSSPGFERAVYDPAGDRMVMVNSNMEVWTLDLASPTAWHLLPVVGSLPPLRTFFAATRDEARNRLIIYGGGPYTGLFNDIWALNLTGTPSWSRIDPSGGPPPPTWGPLAVYDSFGDRLIVGMGASDVNYTTNSNLFAVNLAGPPVWTPFTPSGSTPPGRMFTAATYDPGLHRVVFFGGYTPLSDTQTLDLSGSPAWAALSPAGTGPPASWSGAAVYRTSGPAIVIYEGHNGGDFTGAWSLSAPVPTGPPVIGSFSRPGGRPGDQVTILGQHLDNVSDVRFFNDLPAPIVSQEFGQLVTTVPSGATTGPITLTNPFGTTVSSMDFVITEVPVVNEAVPDSGRAGDTILLHGLHFTGATSVRFGGTGSASFTVNSDTEISAVVDSLASTGLVVVATPAAEGDGPATFQRIADDPRPHLLSVSDVRGDQGGKVLLRWRASDFDQPRYKQITGYRVWRRAPLTDATGSARPAAAMPGLPQIGPDVFWESLTELPAAFLKGYAFAAPTLSDSSEAGNPYTAYFVQALTADPFVFYNSSPDSGYSVDNLAPPSPSPMTVRYGPAENVMHWHASNAPDLRGYELYRGTSSSFLPSPATLIASIAETSFTDRPGAHYYKLAAIDLHGNHSRFVAVAPDVPVGTLAAFVHSDRAPGHVQLTWYSGGNSGMQAHVQRRTDLADWSTLGTVTVDGTGFLRYDDASAEDGLRYAYRLAILDDQGVEGTFTSEAWIDPLGAMRLSLALGANPAVGGRIALALTLPDAAQAAVTLFDLAGREVERQAIHSSGDGRADVTLGGGERLRPGLYMIRVTSDAATVTRRVVVIL